MKVLYYRDEQSNGEIVDIENTLGAMQTLVKGYIEYVDWFWTCDIPEYRDHEVYIVVNEEGIIRNLDYNRQFPWGQCIMGPFFICGYTENEDGETVETDISKEDEEFFRSIYDY